MEHNRIALIASLDTKLQETLYAKHEIESCGGQGLIIDISTKTLVDAGAAVACVPPLFSAPAPASVRPAPALHWACRLQPGSFRHSFRAVAA